MHRFNCIVALLCALGAGAAHAASYLLPPRGVDVIGEVKHIRAHYEDTFVDLARYYDVGYQDLVQANPGVDPWLPGEGTKIVIPDALRAAERHASGIVLNIPEMRLYYYPAPQKGEQPVVMTFPIGIGREGWTTPLARTRVTNKVRDPAWYPPESVRAEHAAEGDPLPRVVPAGPTIRWAPMPCDWRFPPI